MTTSPEAGVRGVRRVMIVATVGSLAIAAVLGIVALLSGELDETAARVVATTAAVAAFGTTSLCHLAVVTRSVRAVGFAGIAASVGAACCALVLIWGDWSGVDDAWWKTLGVLAIAAFSLAQANLLLLLAGRPHPAIRVGLGITLAAIAAVAVLVALPVLTDGRIPGDDDGDGYWRLLGVLAILDALGTIALPVLGLVLRRRDTPRTRSGTGTVRLVLDVPADLVQRLDASGQAREATALAALEHGLAVATATGSPGTAWPDGSRLGRPVPGGGTAVS